MIASILTDLASGLAISAGLGGARILFRPALSRLRDWARERAEVA